MTTCQAVPIRAASAERFKIQATSVPIDDLVPERSYTDNPGPNSQSRPSPSGPPPPGIKGAGVWGQSPQLYLYSANNFLQSEARGTTI